MKTIEQIMNEAQDTINGCVAQERVIADSIGNIRVKFAILLNECNGIIQEQDKRIEELEKELEDVKK